MSRDQFVALVTADQPDAPPYFTYDAVLNAKQRPTLEAVLQRVLTPLSLAAVLEMSTEAAAQLLDVREPAEFAHGHMVGSLNIGLTGQYATWAGTMLASDRPIVIIAELGREEEAATRLGRIGFDTVAGYLDGGMEALEVRPDLIVATPRATAIAAEEALSHSAAPPLVLDVRTTREWEARHIRGSLNVPLHQLRERVSALPRGRPLLICCASGYRSSIAASLLQCHGFDDLVELTGGMAAWKVAKLPMEGAGVEEVTHVSRTGRSVSRT